MKGYKVLNRLAHINFFKGGIKPLSVVLIAGLVGFEVFNINLKILCFSYHSKNHLKD